MTLPTYNPPWDPSLPQLLVSVRNLAEARLAHAAGVAWIDLKQPAAGSLGAPDLDVAQEVASFLRSRALTDARLQAPVQAESPATTAPAKSAGGALAPEIPWGNLPHKTCSRNQFSVALGELTELSEAAAQALCNTFPVCKVGLAATADAEHRFQPSRCAQLASLAQNLCAPGQLVLASYADFQRAAAPEPREVVSLSAQLGCRYVLLDTYIKDGRGLLQWLDVAYLRQLQLAAQQAGAALVLAGSLQLGDLPQLAAVGCAIVAVRGAVCAGDRRSQLDPTRIQVWLEALRRLVPLQAPSPQ
jgi:(5-formylfuran-3-yl)methyl phosphate synthase